MTQRDGKIYHDCGLEESILQKLLYCPKQSTIQCNTKLTRYFSQNQKKILQFVWKHKRPQIANATLRKNNRTGKVKHADLRLTTRLQ